MEEFKPIETQEQFDIAVQDILKAKQKKYENYMSPAEVKKKYEGYMSPEAVEKKYKGYITADVAAEKDSKIREYEMQAMKANVAEKLGLTREAIEFIKGDNEDDIKRSAETLKAMLGKAGAPPLRSNETNREKSTDEALRSTLRKLKGE